LTRLRVRWSEHASADLIDILEFIDQEQPAAARKIGRYSLVGVTLKAPSTSREAGSGDVGAGYLGLQADPRDGISDHLAGEDRDCRYFGSVGQPPRHHGRVIAAARALEACRSFLDRVDLPPRGSTWRKNIVSQ
jgi:plasmid stabilization system protein ParE